MTKQYYVIKKSNGELLKASGKVLFFDTATEAMTYVNIAYGSSPYLTVDKWRGNRKG